MAAAWPPRALPGAVKILAAGIAAGAIRRMSWRLEQMSSNRPERCRAAAGAVKILAARPP